MVDATPAEEEQENTVELNAQSAKTPETPPSTTKVGKSEYTLQDLFGSKKEGKKPMVPKEVLELLHKLTSKIGKNPKEAMSGYVAAFNLPFVQKQPNPYVVALRRLQAQWYGEYATRGQGLVVVPVSLESYINTKEVGILRKVAAIGFVMPDADGSAPPFKGPVSIVQMRISNKSDVIEMKVGKAYSLSGSLQDGAERVKTIFVDASAPIREVPIPEGEPILENPVRAFIGTDVATPLSEVWNPKRVNESHIFEGFVALTGTRSSKEGGTRGWWRVFDDSIQGTHEDLKKMEGGIRATVDASLAAVGQGSMFRAWGRVNRYTDKNKHEQVSVEFSVVDVLQDLSVAEGTGNNGVPNPGKSVMTSPDEDDGNPNPAWEG